MAEIMLPGTYESEQVKVLKELLLSRMPGLYVSNTSPTYYKHNVYVRCDEANEETIRNCVFNIIVSELTNIKHSHKDMLDYNFYNFMNSDKSMTFKSYVLCNNGISAIKELKAHLGCTLKEAHELFLKVKKEHKDGTLSA